MKLNEYGAEMMMMMMMMMITTFIAGARAGGLAHPEPELT